MDVELYDYVGVYDGGGTHKTGEVVGVKAGESEEDGEGDTEGGGIGADAECLSTSIDSEGA